MLTSAPADTAAHAEDDDAWFSIWRARELGRVERAGITYADYTGAALYPESLITADVRRLQDCVLGNPHSESAPSRDATADLYAARSAILEFLAASPDEYVVILTPNATAGCRLVGESFPFANGSALMLSADNHNSVNGIREFAVARGAAVRAIGLDDELQLRAPFEAVARCPHAPSLLAFPAQSNFSGVRHPLSLVREAQHRGWKVLLDAASFVPGAPLRLDQVQPEFVVISLYKIIGYPTGLGALIARRDALEELKRPWFAGGTVLWASVQNQRHRLSPGPERFEDGTPPYLAAGAVAVALEHAHRADRTRLSRHLQDLTRRSLEGLTALRHRDGAALICVHGPREAARRGATIAISLRDRSGGAIPYWVVEDAARAAGIAVRGGCFCNPGCAEAAFRFEAEATGRCLGELGEAFSVPRFAACLGDQPVGAIRISFGLGSVRRDVDRIVEFFERYVSDRAPVPEHGAARAA